MFQPVKENGYLAPFWFYQNGAHSNEILPQYFYYLHFAIMSTNPITPQAVHNFFEKPETVFAKAVHTLIFLCIIVSIVSIGIEFAYPNVFKKYADALQISEYIILGIFTIEYILRLASAPNKKRYALKPMSIVDLLAIAPSYIELLLPIFGGASLLRGVRVLRLLRLSRVLRAFKLFRFNSLFKKLFRYEGTILQTITPMICVFVVGKAIIWALEVHGFWLQDPSLGELFAIIGFALGIILSQKIGVTYSKFVEVEETVMRITATLRSVILILNKVEARLGTNACLRWSKEFYELITDPVANNAKIYPYNDELYEAISRAEDSPAEMAVMHSQICNDAAFCLGKKVRVTPKAYDTLLHQVTMLYFAMIIIFIPGFTGLVSVVLATYTLYGMYNLTEDLDSIIGGEFDLIDIDMSELENFVTQTPNNTSTSSPQLS